MRLLAESPQKFSRQLTTLPYDPIRKTTRTIREIALVTCCPCFYRKLEKNIIKILRSMVVSGKLPVYPSPKITLTLTCFSVQNVRFWVGVGGQFPENDH